MGSSLSILLPSNPVGYSMVIHRRRLLQVYLPILATSYFIYCFTIKPFLSPLRKIPGLPYHPIFGNMREAIKGEAMETSLRWVRKYGGIVRYYGLLGHEFVLVADTDALKHILVTHQHKYGRPTPTNVPLGRSVLTVTGDEHKVLRHLLNPVFSPETIKGYLPVFEKFAYQLVRYWQGVLATKESGKLDVQSDLFRTTFDVFGEAVLGCNFGSLVNPEAELVKAFKNVLSLDSVSYKALIPFYKHLPTAENRARWESLRVVNKTIASVLAQKQNLLHDEGPASVDDVKHDLLSRLIMARDEESGKGLTHEEMRDELFTLIFAGYETTAMTISWILLTLAQNQVIQDKVRSEVNAILQGEGQLKWEELSELKYLDCVIKEGQRLYPAASAVKRYAVEDDELNGYHIPRGTEITCHFGTLMRNPAVWERPETFDPDRFLESDATSRLYAYLPFGTGPTKCLGHQFARVQMKTVIAVLIHHFEFDTIPGVEVRRKHRATLKAVPHISLHVTSLHQ